MNGKQWRRTAAGAALLLCALALGGCAATDQQSAHQSLAADCTTATTLEHTGSSRLLAVRPTSAVMCDGTTAIRIAHPRALEQLLNQSAPVADASTFHCPLDDGSSIRVVVVGTDVETGRQDGQLVFVHTSGCGFADTTTGTWILGSATWSMLERLDPELHGPGPGAVQLTAQPHCCAALTR